MGLIDVKLCTLVCGVWASFVIFGIAQEGLTRTKFGAVRLCLSLTFSHRLRSRRCRAPGAALCPALCSAVPVSLRAASRPLCRRAVLAPLLIRPARSALSQDGDSDGEQFKFTTFLVLLQSVGNSLVAAVLLILSCVADRCRPVAADPK